MHSPITMLISQTHLSCWMVLHRYLSTLMTHKASISLFSIMQFSWVASMTSAMWNPFTESVMSGYWVSDIQLLSKRSYGVSEMQLQSVKCSYWVREMQLPSWWNAATELVNSSYWVGEIHKLQAPVDDILPSTTAVFSYTIGSRKLSANEQYFGYRSNRSKFVTSNSDYMRCLFYNWPDCLRLLE